MKRTIVFMLILTIGLLSCNNSKKEETKETSKLEIAKAYYNSLDDSDGAEILNVLADSIVIRENTDDYEERFSQNGYTEWLAWDSVFQPTYKILEIEKENEMVKAKISKIDIRILFLTEEPIVWNEILRFSNNKIVKVERVKYEVFNVEKFLKNRNRLVTWIDENHPEFSGFLFPQNKSTGKKYLKAIELFQQENITQDNK